MPDQLNLFGEWEVLPTPPARKELPPEEPAPDPVPVLPGQQTLFEGAHLGEAEVDAALEALDPVALLTLASQTRRRYPKYTPARRWVGWVETLEWLAEGTDAERLANALSLETRPVARARMKGMGPTRSARLVGAAVRRAAEGLIASDGPAGRLPDGRPLGDLLWRHGAVARGCEVLEAARAAELSEPAFMVALAACLDASGEGGRARGLWLTAALADPPRVAASPDLPPSLGDLVGEAEDLALPGEPGDWLAALGDLRGVWALPAPDDWPPVAPERAEAAACPGLTFALHLAALRVATRNGASPPERRGLKAALLSLAPALKDALRRV